MGRCCSSDLFDNHGKGSASAEPLPLFYVVILNAVKDPRIFVLLLQWLIRTKELRMARVSLQIKNVASILLAAAASASSGVTVKMYLDHKSWAIPAVCLAAALLCQLGLIFVESKEEEELSLIRKHRLAAARAEFEEGEALSARIQQEIRTGSPQVVADWEEFRRKRHGK